MPSSLAHENIRKAISALYYIYPPVTLLFYVLAATISVCTLQTISTKLRYEKVSRRAILWLMTGVTATYIAEAAIQTTSIVQGHLDQFAQDRNVFALSSTLVWFILTVSLLDSACPVWYPYYGSWVIALMAELVHVTLSIVHHRPTDTIDFLHLGLASIRIFSFLLLLLFLFGGRCLRAGYTPHDQENQPLLASCRVKDFSEESGNTQSGIKYGTTPAGESRPAAAATEESDSGAEDNERERVARERIEDCLRNNGNWWTYAQGFLVFIPFIWPSKDRVLQLHLIGVGLCLLAGRALNILIPRQVGIVANSLGLSEGQVPWLDISLFMLYSWLNSSAGVYALKNFLWLPVEQYTYKTINTTAYNHIMNLSSEFHDGKRSGELYQTIRLGHSVNNLLETIMFQTLPMLIDLAVAFTYLYYLFDAYMALIVGAVVVVYLWASTYFNAWHIAARRGFVGKLKKEWDILYDSMGSWQTVSYFNRIKHEQERYSSAVEAHLVSRRKYTALAYLAHGTQSMVLTVGLLSACFLAAYQVIHGTQSVGSFIVLLTYWAQLSGPLSFFGSAFRQISRDFLDAEQLLQLLQHRPTVADQAGATALILHKGEVEFDQVNFSYNSQKEILKGVSFRALPGQTVALVGETGGGKSTILKLLFRFYDVTQGSIKIDGQNIRNVTLESLRDTIGVVPQDPSLFNETIMSNVRYARLGATDEEVYDACKAAAIHEKIMSFASGYQSMVGERGVKLSGGELQRVAIARAILKNPNIILLDEATSSVDTETELHIQEALHELTLGRTTFVVAHRLSTVMKANLIMVVKDGEIIERGTHDELFRAKGKYYSLWSKQIFLDQNRGSSKSPKRGQDIKRTDGLRLSVKSQDPPATVTSFTHAHGHDTKMLSSREPEQESSYGQANDQADKENRAIVKDDEAAKRRSPSLRDKFWRPDAPEFVPLYLRTSLGPGSLPLDQQKDSFHEQSRAHQEDVQNGVINVPRGSDRAKGITNEVKDDNSNRKSVLPELQFPTIDPRENGTVNSKTERDRKRRWRKRKSRDPEETVQQPPASVCHASPGHLPTDNKASEPKGATSPASNKGEEAKPKAKRSRTNRRAQSKSEPTGQGRSQIDGTSEFEPASTASSDGQPMGNVIRRVSAPSNPPSGKSISKWPNNVRRRRRRHWRNQAGETSGTQSTRSTSWATECNQAVIPAAPVTSPSNGVQATNSTTHGLSGSSVRFAPGF